MVKPLPAVNVAGLPVIMAPSSKSPFAKVVVFIVLGDALFPCATAVVSSEFASATPEYSRMAKRSVPETVSDTVTVFAPPATFSA